MRAQGVECVATRCPRCGFAFPARPLQRPDTAGRRDWLSALLAAVIVIGAVVVVGNRLFEVLAEWNACLERHLISYADPTPPPTPLLRP